MPVVNTAGKLVRMEGGDIATVALMAAFILTDTTIDNAEEAAKEAVKTYTHVVEQVNAFNQAHLKSAVKGAGPHEQ